MAVTQQERDDAQAQGKAWAEVIAAPSTQQQAKPRPSGGWAIFGGDGAIPVLPPAQHAGKHREKGKPTAKATGQALRTGGRAFGSRTGTGAKLAAWTWLTRNNRKRRKSVPRAFLFGLLLGGHKPQGAAAWSPATRARVTRNRKRTSSGQFAAGARR